MHSNTGTFCPLNLTRSFEKEDTILRIRQDIKVPNATAQAEWGWKAKLQSLHSWDGGVDAEDCF